MIFRKVSANEDKYKEIKNRYNSEYWSFRDFAHSLTLDAGNVKKSSSKAIHYGRFLLYLIVLYEENFNLEFGELHSLSALKKLQEIESSLGFKKFNEENNYFYSATIRCFNFYLDTILSI